MHSLLPNPSGANRPLFVFEGPDDLTAIAIPADQLCLSGPSEVLDAPHWPVRGDLAHIRLAGRVFVPHYAVPMPASIVADGTQLRIAGQAGADVRQELVGGSTFNVLDIAGGWAWGQVGEDGFVGYVPVSALDL